MVILGNRLQMEHPNQPPEADAIHVDEQDHYNDDWVPPFNLRETVRIRTNQKFDDYYNLYEEIGEGKFGKVFRCVEKATKLELAAKSIRLKKDTDLAKVEKEVMIHLKMRHKCIAQIYDAFAVSATEIILIMEFVSGGELFDRVVDDNYVLTETAVAVIMYQICEAIRYIHSQNIIHLDLKPENIICVSLTGNQIKLIDFGLAQFYDGQHDLLFMAGTPEFAAPEVIKYEPLDFHTDMWSIGVIAYILLSGQSPFLGDNIALTYCNVEKGRWSFCEEFEENGISEEARDFITKLLIVEKNKRMLPEECLQHPWIINSLERARNKSLKEKPLDTGKLRKYVRNSQFRRVVFGVMFINSVTRMLNTLQARKSENGIKYVQNMLNATVENGSSTPVQALVKSAFTKRRRNVTGEGVKEAATTDSKSTPVSDVPSTSQEGNELHRKPKRSNNGTAQFDDTEKEVSKNVLEIPAKSDASSPEGSRTASPKLIKRQRDKANRPKSSSRKASSSEQAAKKPKQGSSGTLKAMAEAALDLKNATADSTKSTNDISEIKKVEASTKVGDILAKFQQQTNQNTSTFTLPVACAVVPPKRQTDTDIESSVKVTLTRPEEKPAKVKKLKKPKDDSKSADSILDSGVSETRKNLVSSMLRKLEKNDAPPMVMAVSSFIPTPKVEEAVVVDKPKSKVLRIEAIKNESPINSTTSVQTLNLEKKVVSEKKTKLKKKEQNKKMESGDSTSTKGEHEKQSIQELSVKHKTTVNQFGAQTIESSKMNLANSVKEKERGEVKKLETSTKHLAEKSLETIASLEIEKSTRDGKKLRKKQLAVSDEESTKAGVDTIISIKKMLKKANGTAENKRVQKAVAIENGVKGSVEVETKKTIAFSNNKPDPEQKSETKIRFSIEDDVAAFKALMNKRRNKGTSKLAENSIDARNLESVSDRAKLQTSRSLQLEDDDENDDDSLIQAEQDAFDFSVLRSKLENRLSGKQTADQDSTYLENHNMKEQTLAEIRSKLSDTGNIKRAMSKWMQMDKANQHK